MSKSYITGREAMPGGPQPGTGYADQQMVENIDLIFGDNEELKFGDLPDAIMAWDGTDLTLDIAAGKFLLTSTVGTVTGEAHALSVVATGTLSSGDALVGLNVAVTPAGASGAWAAAIFGKVTEVAAAPGPVSGYFCGAEFEVNITGSQPSAYAVLVLNSNADNSTYGQFEGYIWLREYGTKAVRSLFNFMDHARASASNAVIVSQTTDKPYDTMIRCTIGSAGTTPLWLMASSVGPATAGLESGSVVHILNQAPQAFKYECDLSTQQGAWVHGMKVEVTRTANVQPATGTWFGAQFVLNAGTDGGYAILDKPAYVLQCVFKGSRTLAATGVCQVARFETQSSGKVDQMVYILANTGTTVEGSLLYLATHIAPGLAMLNINVQSSQTVAQGIHFEAGAGSTFTSLLYCMGAGTFTNFLEVAADGDGGVTLGTGMFKDPEDNAEAGYITIKVGATSYQIPFYASA